MSKNFHLHLDGPSGVNGVHGQNGSNGHGAGAPGQNGQDAGQSTAGRNAGRVDLYLSADNHKLALTTAAVPPSHSPWAEPEIHKHVLNVDETIYVTAIGGNGGHGGKGGHGGNGAQGSRGRDATRIHSGSNGGPGGAGGDGGNGSSGSEGGKGGAIDIHLTDNDSYLLMAVYHSDTPEDRIHGGRGGKKGSGGRGGKGGQGGKGGSSYRWTDSDGNRHYKSGGSTGPRGPNGRNSLLNLTNGATGEDGHFAIHITDRPKQTFYSCFDFRLAGIQPHSNERLEKTNCHFFQFGDTIDVVNIDVVNGGGMVSPVQSSEVRVLQSNYIIPVVDDVAFILQRIEPSRSSRSPDTLSFHVPLPDIRAMGDDMNAFRCQDRLHLGCTQLGPNGFARQYRNFDLNGKLLEFRFPVENKTGLHGLPTIRAGDGMRVKLALTNTSLSDLGINSSSRRKLFVQFYRNPKARFDVASHHVDVMIENTECNTKLDENTSSSVWRGTRMPIEFLASGDTLEIVGKLCLSAQVTPYSCFALQAELVLQDLPSGSDTASAEPSFSPIQRRQLEVSSEPAYWPSMSNRVVLVSSSATTKEEFVSWNSLFKERLGLQVGYYSVSIYGSLSPTFELSNRTTLAEAFKDKLVVILDGTFNPLDESVSSMNPSCMLPNGCQSQSSGFDASTRWLLVGSSREAVQQALSSHFNAPPTDANSYDSVRMFYREFKKKLREEQENGYVTDECIREDVIRITPPDLHRARKQAKHVKRFIERRDRLRQYIVTAQDQIHKNDKGVSYRTIVVRRGYCRTCNSVSVLKGASTRATRDSSALLATVQSLPYDSLVRVFPHAISHEDHGLIEVCLDAFTQAILWDLSNFLDGRFQVSENMKKAFPSISELSEEMNVLVAQGGGPSRSAISRLLARFECVVNAQDLNPWWKPFSSKHAIRRALRKLVAALEEKWSTAVIPSTLDAERKKLEDDVLKHLREHYTGFFTATRLYGRWRKALLYVCSHRNQRKYRASCGTYRLIEMETDQHTKKSRAICPSKIVTKDRDCQAMRRQAQRQLKMADQLLTSIQATRDLEEIRDEDEIHV